VFTANRRQTFHLPKSVAFPDGVRQVEIIKIGENRLVCPVGTRWDDLFAYGPRASDDFMNQRAQPDLEAMEDWVADKE
jgi:antitoxin VapB